MADSSVPVAIGVALPTHLGMLAARMLAGEGWRLVEVADLPALIELVGRSSCEQVWWGPGIDAAAVDATLARLGYAGRRAPIPSPLDRHNLRASLGLLPSPLNPETLTRLAEDLGDEQSVRDLADLFLESLDGRWRDAQAAWHSGDAETARRAAHTLKSSAALLGLVPLAEVFKELETLAAEGQLDVAEKLGAQAGPTLENAVQALKEWLVSR